MSEAPETGNARDRYVSECLQLARKTYKIADIIASKHPASTVKVHERHSLEQMNLTLRRIETLLRAVAPKRLDQKLSSKCASKVEAWKADVSLKLTLGARAQLVRQFGTLLNMHDSIKVAVKASNAHSVDSAAMKDDAFDLWQSVHPDTTRAEFFSGHVGKSHPLAGLVEKIQNVSPDRDIARLTLREALNIVVVGIPPKFQPYLAAMIIVLGCTQFNLRQLERCADIRLDAVKHLLETRAPSNKEIKRKELFTLPEYLDLCEDLNMPTLVDLSQVSARTILDKFKRNISFGYNKRRLLYLLRLLHLAGRDADVYWLEARSGKSRGDGDFAECLSRRSDWLRAMVDGFMEASMSSDDAQFAFARKYKHQQRTALCLLLRFMDQHVTDNLREYVADNGQPVEWLMKTADVDMWREIIVQYANSRRYRGTTITARARNPARRPVHTFLRFLKGGLRKFVACENIEMLEVKPIMKMVAKVQTEYDAEKRRVYTIEEIARLFEIADTPQKQLLLTMLEQVALRAAELGHLQWKHLVRDHTPRDKTTVLQKRGAKRSFLIKDSLRRRIQVAYDNYRSAHPDINDFDECYVFNLEYPHSPCDHISRIVKQLADASGIDSVHIYTHGFRHTFITRLLEAGNDILTASRMIGHASVSTTADNYCVETLEQLSKRAKDPFSPDFVPPAPQHEIDEEVKDVEDQNEQLYTLLRKLKDMSDDPDAVVAVLQSTACRELVQKIESASSAHSTHSSRSSSADASSEASYNRAPTGTKRKRQGSKSETPSKMPKYKKAGESNNEEEDEDSSQDGSEEDEYQPGSSYC